MTISNRVQLIAYPDHIGRNLRDLGDFVDRHLATAVGGVHLLPPFPSNADGGFSPLTHREIDAAFGDWSDVERIARRYELCIDLVLNHLSDESPEFLDFVRHGRASPWAGLFVDADRFGEFTHDELAKIHIRKEKEPFREIRFDDGSRGRVWCTFTERQIDLDYEAEITFRMMAETIAFLAARGVKLFRLDAFGYVTKRRGTNCFLVEPDVWRILEWFRHTAAEHGAEVLPEVHDHPSYQFAIAARGMWAYGFALPPLVLQALFDCDGTFLKAWLRMCPRKQVTVLDTHDGICIPDVEGFLPADRVQAVVDNVSLRSADPVLRRSAAATHSVGAIYQLTCTFYDALGQNDDAYIVARAIQLFTPGIPQVYYVGLLAGSNDTASGTHSGDARGVNRHRYTVEEAEAALERPVVRRLIELMELRSTHPAFNGAFELHYSDASSLSLAWRNGEHHCHLFVDLNFRIATVSCSRPGEPDANYRA